MKRFLVCLVLLLPSLPVLAQDYLPRDVQGFMHRRENCDHLRRLAFDARENLLKSCIGTDKELVQLKRKYAANSTIMQILNQFDVATDTADMVETPVSAPAPKKRKAQTRRVSAK